MWPEQREAWHALQDQDTETEAETETDTGTEKN